MRQEKQTKPTNSPEVLYHATPIENIRGIEIIGLEAQKVGKPCPENPNRIQVPAVFGFPTKIQAVSYAYERGFCEDFAIIKIYAKNYRTIIDPEYIDTAEFFEGYSYAILEDVKPEDIEVLENEGEN